MARIIDSQAKNMVGDKVRQLRIAKGMTQKELSERLELEAVYVCRGSVSRLEDCQRTVTDFELYSLAKILGVSVEEFFKTT